ncbi:DUF2515 family protein [Evansella sp. AB-rgal1]|uniref:DUF2515 family protein n=1 Tax=Evansella sp. AB-rgal1 TaxID=3242696 RepID=UPI00359D38BA
MIFREDRGFINNTLKYSKSFLNFSKKMYDEHVFQKFTPRKWGELSISTTTLHSIESDIKTQIENISSALPIYPEEKLVIEKIKSLTIERNSNNITRTAAYLEFYMDHDEIHWAFLAHMVSRNGGYNMTDLKGEVISNFLNVKEKIHFFLMLEKANAAIFHDAYTQLLLYKESIKQGKSFFYLLPAFGVSRFMIPIWEKFYNTKNSQLLTVGLIINEQHYLEKRVMENSFFQKSVFTSWKFELQEYFHLTKVLFPYYRKNRISLAGMNVNNFTSVEERIKVGKKLYAILFGIPIIYDGCNKFAKSIIHSGSREDYCTYFTANKEESAKLFSPKLVNVWENQQHSFQAGDWLTSVSVMEFFSSVETPARFDLTIDYELQIKQWVALKKVSGEIFS